MDNEGGREGVKGEGRGKGRGRRREGRKVEG